jgi:hypothetical protein
MRSNRKMEEKREGELAAEAKEQIEHEKMKQKDNDK